MILLLLAGCDGEAAPPPQLAVGGGDASRGRTAIRAHGCGSCHVIPGIPEAVSWVGPPLVEWSRRGILAGRWPNTPENLVRWLHDTQAMAPGSAMPTVGLSEGESRDAAAYLLSLGAARALVQPAGIPTGPGVGGQRPEARLRPGIAQPGAPRAAAPAAGSRSPSLSAPQ